MRARANVFLYLLLVLVHSKAESNLQNECRKRFIKPSDPDNFVCVCNATVCHTLPDDDAWGRQQQLTMFTTSKEGKRFERSIWNFVSKKSDLLRQQLGDTFDNEITVGRPRRSSHTLIKGFGAALTDAAAINLNSLDEAAKDKLISAYFSTKGSEYSIVRIPIASCDFSTREYSYAEVEGDTTLKHFKLVDEDGWKVGYLKEFQKRSSHGLYVFASPWSAPGWMKSNGRMKGGGTLLDKYRESYAEYLVRFLQEYNNAGVDIQGMTVQNEPSTGSDPDYSFQTMYFSAEDEEQFVKNYLGPQLAQKFPTLELMIDDDFRGSLPDFADVFFNDTDAASYANGIAVHWYDREKVGPSVLLKTKEAHPDKFILSTEACSYDKDVRVDYGSWKRGDNYAKDILENLLHGVSGWVDWNLALNMEGGPNWVQNYVDSPILVNAQKQEFYLQPMYYVLAHFSKYVKPTMFLSDFKLKKQIPDLDVAVFQDPSNNKTIVIRNAQNRDFEVKISDASCNGHTVIVPIDANSVNSLAYRCNVL
uniref:Glucosylceramidase n=1 Tax=Steinernema glaseri TaxID=37863 RepID=A0A1I7YW22_9BILA